MEKTEEWGGEHNPLADPREREHLLSVLDSFRGYRPRAHYNGTHLRRQAFYSLPQAHWTLLSQPPFNILSHFNNLDDLIDSNAILAEEIFKIGFKGFIAPTVDSGWAASILDPKRAHDDFYVFSTVLGKLGGKSSVGDVDKARSCITQFYREWSAEGKAERDKCFRPILHTVAKELARRRTHIPDLDAAEIKLLVPGAGLGRLVFDLCLEGYTVEGNEISYHELIASSLLLNHTTGVGQYKLAPFALNASNNLTREHQFQTVQVPDVHPAAELQKASSKSKVHFSERMSMSAGDFCLVYKEMNCQDVYDVIATVFFIDTAPNIIRYIETILHCLKPGGLWINLGPLKWHFASRPYEEKTQETQNKSLHDDTGIDEPGSVELTDEEVVKLVEHLGFTIEQHEMGTIETGYITAPNSMQPHMYRPSFWVARKR